jgi:hypothetical protein
LSGGSDSQARSLLDRTSSGQWVYPNRVPMGDIQQELDEDLARLADRGEFRRIVSVILQDKINSYLSNACRQVLLSDAHSFSFQIKLIPRDLLGFMWVQLAEAVAGGRRFRQCGSCFRWMEIAPGEGRPEKHYCSDACRMRAYRKRKAKRDQTRAGR